PTRDGLELHLQRRVKAAQLVRLVEVARGFRDLRPAVVASAPAALSRQVRRRLHPLLLQRQRARFGRRRQRFCFPVGVDRLQVAAILVIEVAERGEDLEALRLVLELVLEAVYLRKQGLGIRGVRAGVGGRSCRRLLRGPAGEDREKERDAAFHRAGSNTDCAGEDVSSPSGSGSGSRIGRYARTPRS